MKHAIVILMILAMATMALAETKEPVQNQTQSRGLLNCEGAASLTCDQGTSSPDPAAGGNVETYSCTGLNYGDCGETVYEVCVGADGTLQVDMFYTHTATNDLDLFLLSACEEADCIDASLGTSGEESITAEVTAGTYFVVVDGWSGRCDGAGSHDIAIICDSPCGVASEASSWSELKQRY